MNPHYTQCTNTTGTPILGGGVQRAPNRPPAATWAPGTTPGPKPNAGTGHSLHHRELLGRTGLHVHPSLLPSPIPLLPISSS